MAYNKEILFKEAIEAAQMDDIYFIEDIVSLLPCDKTTFYAHFTVDSNELNTIKKILDKKKISKKAELRNILSRSEKAAEVLALYKLIGTDEERKKLSQGYVDVTTGGDKINDISLNINFKDFTTDEDS